MIADPLVARTDARERWELLDRSGMVVGRLARVFEPPTGMQCVSSAVHAVVTWSREASEPAFQDALNCDRWEVVVPDLIFEPNVCPAAGPRSPAIAGQRVPSRPCSSNRVSLVLWFNPMLENEADRNS